MHYRNRSPTRNRQKATGSTLIFSYKSRLRSFFGVQNFEFQYCRGFQKNEYFWGYEDFVDIFWGDTFWVAKISNILGCLKFLIFFFGERYMLCTSLRMKKKLEDRPLSFESLGRDGNIRGLLIAQTQSIFLGLLLKGSVHNYSLM